MSTDRWITAVSLSSVVRCGESEVVHWGRGLTRLPQALFDWDVAGQGPASRQTTVSVSPRFE